MPDTKHIIDSAILIVHDDHAKATDLAECLTDLGYTATISSAQQAIEKAAVTHPDLALIDLGPLGDTDGVEVAEQIGTQIPLVYMMDEAEEDLLQRAEATRPFGYVIEPIDERQLHLTIQTALSRHKTEVALQETIGEQNEKTQLMETVFESMDEGLAVADASGRLVLGNSRVEQILGLGILDIEPSEWSKAYGAFYLDKKTQLPTEKLPLVRAIQGETIDEIEVFVQNEKRPDGIYVSARSCPLLDNNNEVKGGIVVFSDITKYRIAEIELERTIKKLQNQSELMETTFNSISDAVIIADETGEPIYVNPSVKRIAGTDIHPNKWPEQYGFFHLDRETPIKPEDRPLYRAVFHGEITENEDIFIRNENRPDGVYLRMNACPLRNETGEIRGGVVTFRDVTDQMIAEEALVQAFAHGRLEIVDTILHNIGNAINSVTIGIDTIQQNMSDNPIARRFNALADAIKARESDWINYIQNDPQGQQVLPFVIALAEDFARQQAELAKTFDRVKDRAVHIADIVRTQRALGASTMTRKDITLQNALQSAIKVLQESILKRNIEIQVDCENAPKEIRIQESQFHQMMVNLIKNSIEAIDECAAAGQLKESPCIQIRAYIEGEFLNIDVRDNGIGIDIPDTKRIFAAGYTTKGAGNGLGLHSVANFVIGSGGQIHPLSDGIGKGTTMRVMLRLSSLTATRDIPEGQIEK